MTHPFFQKSLFLIKRLFFLLLFFTLLTSLTKNLLQLQSANKRLAQSKEKLAKEKENTANLENELKTVQSQLYIETQARNQLGLAKEGEVVLVLPEPEVLRKLSPRNRNQETTSLPDPNWKKWAKKFGFYQ